jgi:hypothetical protein
MKTSKNQIKGLERSYTMTFVPIMLLYTFLVLMFASGNGSNIQVGKDINSTKAQNYIEFIGETQHDKKINSTIDNKNKSAVHFDSFAALGKPHITSFTSTMPVKEIKNDKEKGLEIEGWMLDCKLAEQPTSWYKDELDKPLEIEDWMINNSYFGSAPEAFHEDDLQIENWMIDDHLWSY